MKGFTRTEIFRRVTQVGSLVATNLYLKGWATASIYTGRSKMFCIPGLHCYSCPSSVLACPVGSVQSIVSSDGFLGGLASGRPDALAILGVLGFLLAIGFVAGRIACGWVCPFGFLQELLYRIPSPKISVPASWRAGKYVILAVFVFLLPMVLRLTPGAGGDPWFCKVICPSGTMGAGWPLVMLSGGEGVYQTGFLFSWKSAILVLVLLWSITSKRPFCRVICPLGAFWGLSGKLSVFRMRVDHKCVECGQCGTVCPVDISIYRESSSAECIRCARCVGVCPTGAVHLTSRPVEDTDR